MERWPGSSRSWLRGPRSLLLLLITIVALAALTLVALGVRLLQQDRDLARQRRTEILEDAAERAVRVLHDRLNAVRTRLSEPDWAASASDGGSVHVLLTRDEVRVTPLEEVAYVAAPAALPEPPSAPFRDLDDVEARAQNLTGALVMARSLASVSDRGIQAGALVREARILRKMGRSAEALAAYDRLARFTAIDVNGLPADLQARRTRCVVLAELAKADELRREAALLDADLAAGKWPLDRTSYEYVRALVDGWLGRNGQPPTEREAMAAAVDWLRTRWTARNEEPFESRGAFVLDDPAPATVIWVSRDESIAALLAVPSYFEREWLADARSAASPARIALLERSSPPTDAHADGGAFVRRASADTGLPWTLMATLADDVGSAELQSRRQTLLAALAAVLVLLAAGTYLVIRARSREMALARLQSDFVTAVSHEFRTPLTALRQFTDLLDQPADLAREKRLGYQQAQRRATERLHRLVESLLDFGRLEAGKRPFAFQRLDAGLFMRDLLEEFRGELDRSDFSLTLSIGPGEHVINGDPEALARAIWNLIDNAVKYSPRSPDIHVSVGQADGLVAIEVRDRGIGIPPAEQAAIFQKFTRGSAAAERRIKGTGIGLAMVRHIVAAHRGRVDVKSVEGEGSTFTVLIPELQPSTGSGCPELVEGQDCRIAGR